MPWLWSVLLAYLVLFFILGCLVHSPSWIVLGLLLVYVFLIERLLRHSLQVFYACVRIGAKPTPGNWNSLIQLADASYNSGYYTVVEHGRWPRIPVLFLANYPNEVRSFSRFIFPFFPDGTHVPLGLDSGILVFWLGGETMPADGHDSQHQETTRTDPDIFHVM